MKLDSTRKTALEELLKLSEPTLDDAIAIVEAYIYVRKGMEVSIDLEKTASNVPTMWKHVIRESEMTKFERALEDALEWFGSNFNGL